MHQMEKHKISATFERRRLLEVFQSFLTSELEDIINETALSHRMIKQQRRALWCAIKHEREQIEEELAPITQQNFELRREMVRLGIQVDTSQWKTEQVLQERSVRVGEAQSQMARARPQLVAAKQELELLLESLTSAKEEILSFKVNSVSRLFGKQWNLYVERLKGQNPVEELQSDLAVQKQITAEMSQAMTTLANFVADPERKVRGTFREQLQRRIGSGGRPKCMINGRQIVSRVGELVERKTEEYNERIRKHAQRMEMLKQELARAEQRLKQLLKEELFPEKQLIGDIEASHTVLKKTQAKTDKLMTELFGEEGEEVVSVVSLSASPISLKTPS
jgi:hypothetical protein